MPTDVGATLTARPIPEAAVRPDRHASTGQPPSLVGVLRSPRFALLVAGQTVSQLGDKLHHMALIALVGAAAASVTGGIELAKLSVVFTAPVVLFGPLAGAMVDQWDKRRTMMLCDAMRALLVFAIPALFFASGHLWVVYAIAFLVFALGVFFNAAKMALIPELVQRTEYLSANAALSFVGRFATVLGIVGGGVIIGLAVWRRLGWTDYAAGFYLDAASYLASVLTLAAMGLTSTERRRVAHQAVVPATGRQPRTLAMLARQVMGTLRTVRHDASMRFVFGSLLQLALFASTVYVAMTYSVQTLLGQGTKGVGYLGGVLGAGLIVGSLLAGTIGQRWDKRRVIRVGNTVIGLLLIVAGARYSFAVFMPVAFLGGVLLAPVMVSQDTMLHEAAPADARALIFSTKDLIAAGAFAVCALLVGGAILGLGHLGVAEPYRMALGGVGVVILVSGLLDQWTEKRATAS